MCIAYMVYWAERTMSNDGEISRYLHVSTESPSTVTSGAATARVPWAHNAAQVRWQIKTSVI